MQYNNYHPVLNISELQCLIYSMYVVAKVADSSKYWNHQYMWSAVIIFFWNKVWGWIFRERGANEIMSCLMKSVFEYVTLRGCSRYLYWQSISWTGSCHCVMFSSCSVISVRNISGLEGDTRWLDWSKCILAYAHLHTHTNMHTQWGRS